jgi:hypothetical protein
MPAQVDSTGERVKRLATITLGLWCGSAAAGEAPFAPLPNVPDYVATFTVKPQSGGSRNISRTVTHHAGWARIDDAINDQHRLTSYIRIAEPLTITIRRNSEPDSLQAHLAIRRGAEAHREHRWDQNAFKTEVRDVIAGVPCEIWDVMRTATDGPGNTKNELKRLSCVTDDGIELRNRFVATRYDGTLVEATSLVRRPVSAADVLPPSELFELKTWTTEPASNNARGDVTVTMENLRSGTHPDNIKMRIVRRHHPWTRSEDVHVGGQRKGAITTADQRLRVQFEINPDGQLTNLILMKIPAAVDVDFTRGMQPLKGKERETILGEACTWFDMTPGAMDAGRLQCRTDDGLVLVENRIRWASSYAAIVATRIDRGPVALSDVSPAAMLARSNWGLD